MLLDWLFSEYAPGQVHRGKPADHRPVLATRRLSIEPLEERLTLTIVAGGNGTQNTTAPLDDPGFANVGIRSSASAVYLGDGWVLTASHVGGGATYFNNILYQPVTNSAIQLTNPTGVGYTPYTDLTLYQIIGRPDLPSVSIESLAPAVGWNVIMIGHGRDRAPDLTYWNSSWVTQPGPSTYSGYAWASTQSMRWGTNVISSINLTKGVNTNSEAAFATTFTGNTPYDGMGATGDSGGGVFHKDPDGTWHLAGIMFSISQNVGQSASSAVFGNVTYIADLSVYRNQILSIIGANHAPSGSSNTVTTLQGTPYTFGLADFGFSDAADTPPDQLQAIKITTLPGRGTLTDGGVAVSVGQFISAADISSNKLQYLAATGGSGLSYAAFTFQVQDNGGTAGGGVDLDPAPKTMTINVTPVDLVPPTVQSVTPLGGATGVAVNSPVTVTFSEALNVASVTANTIQLRDANSNLVTATVSYNASTKTATLTPTGPLANSTIYTITVVGGASGVADAAGNALAADYVSSFTSVPADVTPPTVQSVTPLGGATGVAVNSPVTVTFSEALNVATVTVNTIQLRDANSNLVSATVSYNASTKTATLTPTGPLANSTTYTVTVVGGANGVADAAGNALAADYVSTFTTVAADLTPPTVQSVTPLGSATGVAVSSLVTVTFSEALNVASVTSNTIQLRDANSNLVSATVTYNASTKTATLTPTGPLANSTTYTITVVGGASGVKDSAGNSLAANYVSSFTTLAAVVPASSLWPANPMPATVDSGDGQSVELGVRFTANTAGYITGIRYYKSAANTGTHVGKLWSSTGQLLATATFSSEGTSGWQQVNFSTPVAITAGTTYVASYHTTTGHYAVNKSYFTSTFSNGPLQVAVNGGVYAYGAGSFPTASYQASNYWVDVIFTAVPPVDNTPPTVTAISPAGNATNVATSAAVTIAFSEALNSATVNAGTILLRDASNNLVAATVTYNAASRTAILTPASALANSSTYSVTVVGGASGVKDLAGNALAANVVSTFTTIAPQSPSSSLWSPEVVPSVADSGDARSVELGVRFTSNTDGFITGIRFYKSTFNGGTHVGNLWSSTGQLLATATFTNEGTSGWQQVTFATPVAITAGATYVASYHTNVGHYAVSKSYFGATYANGALQVAPNGGVYSYGSGGMPTQSYLASNYWVDVLFTTIAPVDNTPPTVISIAPAGGATGVATSAALTITFSEAINPATVTPTALVLRDSSNNLVAASVTYNPATRTATLTPTSALATSTTYTITAAAGASGVKDLAGNALATSVASSFTTAAPLAATTSLWSAAVTPAVVDSGDGQSIELGVRFTATISGFVTGIEFYKSVANTGVHTGSLWSSSGVLLATGTFVNETASGWQEMVFATPIAIAAGTTYVASYHTNVGHYATSRSFFSSALTSGPLKVPASGGVYSYGAGGFPAQSYQSSNYWVDVLFSAG